MIDFDEYSRRLSAHRAWLSDELNAIDSSAEKARTAANQEFLERKEWDWREYLAWGENRKKELRGEINEGFKMR